MNSLFSTEHLVRPELRKGPLPGARTAYSIFLRIALPSMAETIRQLRAAGLGCKVMVGGAVLTPEYAASIGADYYAKDAKRSADIAKEVFGS